MEAELSCSLCCQLLTEPLLLPCCCRAICAACAKTPPQDSNNEDVASDKASVYSETDSGVVVASASTRATHHNLHQIALLPSQSEGVTLSSSNFSANNPTGVNFSANNPTGVPPARCPACHKLLFLGPDGLSGLPPYPAMSRIIERYKMGIFSSGSHNCQLCEGPPKEATTHCVQCKVRYCGPCLSACHPMRGPLSTHTLAPLGATTPSSQQVMGDPMCPTHQEKGSVYCSMCRCVACEVCVVGLHAKHDLQPLDSYAKTQKVITLI